MPAAKLTGKQEAFARAVALEGLDQTAAYSKAYDTSKMAAETINKEASKLGLHPAIATRIDVLKAGATAVAVKKAGYTLADAIDQAEGFVLQAAALGQASAGVAAVKLKAQLAGHLVEKKEITNSALTPSDVQSLRDLQADLAERRKRAKEAQALVGEAEQEAERVPLRRVI